MTTTPNAPQTARDLLDRIGYAAQDILDGIGYAEFVRALFNRSGDPSKDFAHAILGIVTECHEYLTAADVVNAIEEAGDLYFYCVALSHVVSDFVGEDALRDAVDSPRATIRAQALESLPPGALLPAVAAGCAGLLDEAKRWVGYGSLPKAPLGDIYVDAILLAATVIGSGLAENTSPDIVALVNIEKLLQRYQGLSFSADKAMNRDTDKEREVLEGAVGAST